MTVDKIKKIRKFAKDHLDELRWLHTQEVVKLALELAEKEGADREIVEISAWLHDAGRMDKRAKSITHHVYSAKIAQNLLKKLNLEPKKIKKIVQCIKEHMGPIPGFFGEMLKSEGKNWAFLPRPSTKESKVLYDADMIDLCSPFGIVKTIVLSTKENRGFKKPIIKAKALATDAFKDLKTKSGRKIGKKYFSASQAFFKMIKL